MRWMTLLVALAALPAAARAATGPHTVAYLYLEATEGGASGGHAALALGDTVFHFERDSDGLVRLARDDAAAFRHRYAALGNRPIHASHVAVTDDTWKRLRDGFNARYVVQRRQLDARDRLAAERGLLAALAAAPTPDACAGAPDAFRLPGAGLFPTADFADPPTPALVRLRAEVAAMHGATFVEARTAALTARVAKLGPADDVDAGVLDPEALPALAPSFAERLRDDRTMLAALAVLRDAAPLSVEAAVAPPGDAFALTSAERAALGAWSATLARQLVRLVASPRPDAGAALLTGMARLVALDTSLATDRLVLVDAFPDAARRLTAAEVAARPAAVQELRADLATELAAARAAFASAPAPDERAYARLEDAGNQLAELLRGLAAGDGVRVAEAPLVPARSACRADLPTPTVPPAASAAALARVRAAEAAWTAALEERYGYELLARNCVSEIFRTVDEALADADDDAAAASLRRLGGHVAPPEGLAVIPFVSARTVQRTWHVTATDEVASYRQARVRAFARTESPARVWLREGNTLTSTVYQRNADDSVFLFFTDDVVLARPLLGAANVVVGLGASLAGLVVAPVDRGATLSAGLRGVVFSLPELAFANVRKGSFDWVPRAGD